MLMQLVMFSTQSQAHCRHRPSAFDSTVWEELCVSHRENIDSLTGCIMDCINFYVDNTIPTWTVRCFANNKPWINTDIKALLKEEKQRGGAEGCAEGAEEEDQRGEEQLQEYDGGPAAAE